MYQPTSTAHRIANDLLNHPDTVRLGGEATYDTTEDEYPAEASIEFDNGTGMVISDHNDGTVKVYCHSRRMIVRVELVSPDPYLDPDAQYRGMLDTVAQMAVHTYVN